ncbi:hypothetical protein FNW02_36265 [Komarekiella sp. 'clone 1']|uniref:Uncharacterized protein n=1 Tax=Komarekiella delphini-convector SJRDD-AB1 TaxID=2593771 RepID=A0AA40VVG1_9NOST|nr:hypothetical protein [Komarekiella delphini-convector]MBD6621036.1 hypothetical protein [Komarekiella delphini-convector SJRDD-AB1]
MLIKSDRLQKSNRRTTCSVRAILNLPDFHFSIQRTFTTNGTDMTDIDVIHKFYKQIAWAKKCRETTHSNRTLLANSSDKGEVVWTWEEKRS